MGEVCGHSTISGQDGINDSEYFARLPASGVLGLRPSRRSDLEQSVASTPYIHSRQSAALVVATLKYLDSNTLRNCALEGLTGPPKEQQLVPRGIRGSIHGGEATSA